MQELSIEEMRQIELEIADEIDRVCREHGIEYFLAYGSLIGAVRHGGFIPWDDDMDIIMMRDDYERFMEVFEKAKREDRMRLVSYRDGSSPTAFAKVVDTTTLVQDGYSDSKYDMGVWVDVFPYDEVPEEGDAKLFKECTSLGNRRYLSMTDTSSGASPLIRLAKKVICPLLRIKGPYHYARRLDERCTSHRGSGSPVVADLIAWSKPQVIFPKRLFTPVEHEFEGHRYFIPEHYDEYLTIMYGDWRTPVPESEREMHACKAYRI